MCSDVAKNVLGAAFCVVAILSCSVKEDRSVCPCYLTVDPAAIPSSCTEEFPVSLEVSGARDFRCPLSLAEEDCAEEFTVEVPRPNVFLSVFKGSGGCFVPGEGLRIPLGEPCPPVYLYSERVVTNGETARAKPVLRKQYCALTVKIVPVNDVFLESFHLQLEGNVCGYDLDSTPKEGAFQCESHPSEDGLCVALLPRQRDASLMMQVMDGEQSLRYFALGEYIAESGYDWLATDLEDIYLEIDYAATAFTVRVGEWEKTVNIEILI